MSLTILLEIGHDASLRSKTTSEGFTHDWEVFVKGQNGADIHYYVEKVVFYLHETFPNPKRVVKDPPYSLRTSGYAGFKLPIEIHLKNNQEPKRIKFNYELYLQPTGPPIHRVQKEKYTFFNPSEEFRVKLLKGGAVEGGGSNIENSINRGMSIEKNQMTSKPKLSGSDIPKKHKMKLEEPRTTDFENLFGPPIKKTTKIPELPKTKEPPTIKPPNVDKCIDKEKNDKTKSNKNTHKDKEKPKEKSDSLDKRNKEERKKFKDEKSKDRERSKEKSSKKEREKSPAIKPRSPTPKRSPKRDASPVPIQKHSSSKEKDTNKDEKKDKDRDRDKKEEKKSKKDKRDHKESKHKDRDRDKDHRDHKNKESKSREKESNVIKQNETSPIPPPTQNTHKTDKKPKEKEQIKEQPKEEEKVEKSEKVEKIKNELEERQKHKHKKKDRKEKKDEKHSKKEDKKIEKAPNSISTLKDVQVKEEKPITAPPNRQVDKNNLFGSPKSDSPSTPKETEVKVENNSLFLREDESSNDSVKLSSKEASPAPRIPSKSPSPPPPPEPVKKPEPEKKKEPSPKKKEKKERKKDKKIDKEKDEKRKKRKSDPTTTVEEEPPEKINKIEEAAVNSDEESKVSSTEDTTPVVVPPKSECDMDMLRELQRKIMSLKDNADLQRVVQLIAETGQYEVSAHTFDFDLCLLDRSTVRQLQDFFSTIS
ncbi:protein ENL [Diorhabda sublineata]|uniref:protein ENL n=1 Tax=Diorhabda sublineata TaxID=1163346 RepID=UPI0024E0D7F0|nr:protein ENL [Diorhabda sublineata]